MSEARGAEAISEMAEGYGSGRFIRLANHEDAVTGAFLGEPMAYEVVWVGSSTEEYDKDNPAHAGLEVRMVVAWNFFDRERSEMRIWERGITFFHQWKRQRDKHGLQHWFTIERSGKAGSKKTTYLLERGGPIEASRWDELQTLQVLELGKQASDRDAEEPQAQPAVAGAPSSALTTAVANDLKQRLKEMSEAAIDQFLSHFEVSRIKDVPAEKEQSAIRFVDMLENGAPVPTPTREVDPFA
jgi:hypothetical protein